jgi:uncharacterized protein YoaH (UPF0181 family)
MTTVIDPTPELIKIGLMSDLHLEFEPAYRQRIHQTVSRGDSSEAAKALVAMRVRENERGHPESGPDLRALTKAAVDLLLLPGDIDVGGRSVAYADAVASYLGCPILMAIGNHDAYGDNLRRLIAASRKTAAATHGRVAVLEQGRADVLIKGRRLAVLGATLWTDYELCGNRALAMERAGNALNDHSKIRWGDRPLQPSDAHEIHLETKGWLAQEILSARQDSDVVVVMTHHAPIPDAIPPRYRGSDLSPAFASDLRPEIEAWKPDLWVWGHTHFSMQATVGSTRMVSAQRGYIGQEPGAESFAPAVLEI